MLPGYFSNELDRFVLSPDVAGPWLGVGMIARLGYDHVVSRRNLRDLGVMVTLHGLGGCYQQRDKVSGRRWTRELS